MVSSTGRQRVASMEARCYAILRFAVRTNNLHSEETKDLNLVPLLVFYILSISMQLLVILSPSSI